MTTFPVTDETQMQTPVTIQLIDDDIVAADRLYSSSYFRDPANWRKIAMVWLAAQGALLAIYVSPGIDSARFFKVLKFAEIGLHVGLFIVPYALTRLLGPRNARRHFKAMKILHGPIQLSWSDDGLREITETSTVLSPWNHFRKWCEDELSFILFVAPTMYRVVPKRFLTPSQSDDLRSLLKQSGGA